MERRVARRLPEPPAELVYVGSSSPTRRPNRWTVPDGLDPAATQSTAAVVTTAVVAAAFVVVAASVIVLALLGPGGK